MYCWRGVAWRSGRLEGVCQEAEINQKLFRLHPAARKSGETIDAVNQNRKLIEATSCGEESIWRSAIPIDCLALHWRPVPLRDDILLSPVCTLTVEPSTSYMRSDVYDTRMTPATAKSWRRLDAVSPPEFNHATKKQRRCSFVAISLLITRQNRLHFFSATVSSRSRSLYVVVRSSVVCRL